MDLEFVIASICQIYIKALNIFRNFKDKEIFLLNMLYCKMLLFYLFVVYVDIPESETLNNIPVESVVFCFDRQVLESKAREPVVPGYSHIKKDPAFQVDVSHYNILRI